MIDGVRHSLDSCIKCSICTAHCPVARVTGLFAGPKQNGPDLERFRLLGLTAAHPSIDYCTNCKNCDVACPSGVDISAMNCRARARYACEKGLSLRDRLLARVDLAGKFSRMSPSLVNAAGGCRGLRRLGERMLGISADMTMPRFSGKSFRQLFSSIRPFISEQKVVYFPGCHVNYSRPEVGLAVINVLQRSGIQVLEGEFGCCGLPLASAGMLDTARSYARINAGAIKSWAARGYPVITSCPSCSLTLRREYASLFGEDFYGLSDMVTDIFEFLLALRREGRMDTGFKSLPLTAGYHQPCHLKAAGCGSPSRDLLALVPGCRVVDLDAGCCGLSGSYGFKKEKYGLSMEIGSDLFTAISIADYDQVITECGMCRLQVYHGTGVETAHPVEILDRAYGMP